jgi:hypothetical protein
MFFQKIMSPILFQGNQAGAKYFEGWYYKQVSKDGRAAISLIPGVSLAKGDYHCFVQYIYANLDEAAQETIKTGYLKYSLDQFVTIDSPFAIRIANNAFSESKISLTLEDENLTIRGTLSLGAFREIKTSVVMPNIMGFFAYFPKMECYHGVISMEHTLHGILKINGKETDFNGGKGYLEKDWGTSFPARYIWVQCNHFKRKNACVFCSVADIPFLNKTFRGFICCLIADGDEYRFATYNRSKLKVERLTGEEISLLFEHGKTKLRVEAKMKNTGTLIAPKLGKMQEIIKEELFGEVKFTLYNGQNTVIYEDAGNMAGIEVSGFSEKEGSGIWRKKC